MTWSLHVQTFFQVNYFLSLVVWYFFKHITWAYVIATKAKQNKMVDVCIVPSASQNSAAVAKSNFWSGLLYFALLDNDKAARSSPDTCYGPSQSHDT